MSTPMEYYKSIPPVAKTYAVVCLLTTGALELQLYTPRTIALFFSDIFIRFQVWRLITPFFFLGPFSLNFALRLLTILLYGVQLERGPFDKRTADLAWMYIFGAMALLGIAVIPYFWFPFTGPSLVFVLAYVWGREFPNARVNIHNLFELKGFYMPWYMLVVDMLLGNPIKQGLVGIGAGHLYYFLSVLYPISSGRNILKTPTWVHKLVAFWGEGYQMNSPFRNDRNSSESVFQGRSYRLNGGRNASSRSSTTTTTSDSPERNPDTSEPANSAGGVTFRGFQPITRHHAGRAPGYWPRKRSSGGGSDNASLKGGGGRLVARGRGTRRRWEKMVVVGREEDGVSSSYRGSEQDY